MEEQDKLSNRIPRLVSLTAAIFLALAGIAVTRSALAVPTSMPAAQANSYVEVCTWLDCKTGAVSYSQDDARNIAPTSTVSCHIALENAGFRGTFYYDGSSSPDWLTTLSSAGHEVGSHLVNHDLNCATPPSSCGPTCTLEALLQISYTITDVNNFRQSQLDPNVAAIESRTGKPVLSMAYACGYADPARMTAAQSYFMGARSYYKPEDGGPMSWAYDINAPVPDEFMLLNADWYYHQTLVDRAVNENSWEIVTIHDYCEGITALRSISPTTWIAPVGEVLKYIHVRAATQITNYARTGTTISFDAVHNLPVFQRQQLDGTPLLPIVYDNPVTLRARIPITANILSVQANGIEITYTVGTISGIGYVWFNTPLSTTQHIVIQGDAPLAVRVTHLSATQSVADPTLVLIVASGASVCLLIMWMQRQRRRGV